MSISRRLISLTLLSGASTLNADTANRIEQIIVSGVRTEQPALNSPAAVSVRRSRSRVATSAPQRLR